MVKDYQHFNLYDKLIFEKVVLVPPYTGGMAMPNDACFFFALKGKTTVHTPIETAPLEDNSGIVLKCGNHLSKWAAANEGEEVCEGLAVHLYPDVLRKIYDKELPDFLQKVGQVKAVRHQRVKTNEVLKKYVDNLVFYFENPDLVSEELLKLKVKELLLILAKTDNSEAITKLLQSIFSPNLFSFREIIEANVYNNLTNENLAFLCNMSLSSFKREFSKSYDTSPAKYFKIRKLERAAELLKKTDQRIGDIAFDCGFSEIAHFSKSFLKAYGVSPSVFRTQ